MSEVKQGFFPMHPSVIPDSPLEMSDSSEIYIFFWISFPQTAYGGADGVIISHYVDGLTCAISALTFTFALLAHVIFLECAITALNIQHALLRHFDICTCAINAR